MNEVAKSDQKTIQTSIKEHIGSVRFEKRSHKSTKSHSINSYKTQSLKPNPFLQKDPLIIKEDKYIDSMIPMTCDTI